MAADEKQLETTQEAPRVGRPSDNSDPARSSESSPRAKRTLRAQPANAIYAGRVPSRRARLPNRAAPDATAARAAGSGEGDGAGAASRKLPRSDSDPWTVPESVRDRFVQDGHRFYFPDGHPAFRDLGRKLATASENTQVVASLIEIARARGWNEVTVTGTERFREEAWRQARLSGLTVGGFKPSEEQQAQLVRSLARTLTTNAKRVDATSEEPPAPSVPAGSTSRTTEGTSERIAGKLLDHGRDAYRHDPNEEPSYFVQLETREGRREIWGKDLERAVARSLTQPQVGDEVILQRTGRDTVTVKRQVRGQDGALAERDAQAFRNRWQIEKETFFAARAAAADVVRDAQIAPQDAVRQHPELAGTYLSLRAAELAARRLRDPEDQRRFVSQVRRTLADEIERGEPLQPVRLRERGPRDRNPREVERAVGRS